MLTAEPMSSGIETISSNLCFSLDKTGKFRPRGPPGLEIAGRATSLPDMPPPRFRPASREKSDALTCTIEVAGRMSPKNSPCALPIFCHSAMFVTNIRVRTTSFILAPAFCQSALDVFQSLHGLGVGVSHAHYLAVRPGCRGSGNVDTRSNFHRAGVTHHGFPKCAAGDVHSFLLHRFLSSDHSYRSLFLKITILKISIL